MEKNKTHDFGIESERTQYLQEEGLKILSEFHRICEAHNLLYILDYGTLLGAVRHKGFIPWDDDIDVSMPRKDYEKFLEVCEYSLKESFLLQTNKTDPNYFYPYAKLRISDDRLKENLVSHFDMIHGPWIDIFPFDYRFDDKTIEQNK